MNTGYTPSDPRDIEAHYEALRSFAPGVYGASLDSEDVVRQLRGSGKGKLSMPFLHKRRLTPNAGEEFQTTGDCTSHMARNVADTTRAYDILVKGEPEQWIAQGATEYLYGARRHGGQGMAPITCIQFLFNCGMLLRQKYKFADLSKYNGDLGASWGAKWAQTGVPEEITSEASKSPFAFTTRVTSLEDARDLLANGYGVGGGFYVWLSKERDARGVSRTMGTTAHAVEIGGVDDTGREPLWLVNNCHWLGWVKGPHPAWGQLPVGCTMARSDFILDAINRGDLWAVGGATGFPPQRIEDYGTGEFL